MIAFFLKDRHWKKAVRDSYRILNKNGIDIPHARRVARLATQLFSELSFLHDIGKRGEILLFCAALLHDIGYKRSTSQHHIASAEMILETGIKGLNKTETIITALIARYHRKRFPKRNDRPLRDLNARDRDWVYKLASIIRIADGLDATHTGAIDSVTCATRGDEVLFLLKSSVFPEREIQKATKKSSLFMEIFGRPCKFLLENYHSL